MTTNTAGNVQVVFLDIDGTLVVQRQLVASAKESVERLQQNGYRVVLCTGRSYLHTRKLMAELRISDGIFFNGGLVQLNHSMISASPMEHGVVTRIHDYFGEHAIPLIFHTEHDAVSPQPIPTDVQPILHEYDYPPIQSMSFRDWLQKPVPVFQANVFMDKSWDNKVSQLFPECLVYRWDANAIDLQKKGSDKSVGALTLLRTLGIDAKRCMHIGDGGNDIGMFRSIGIPVAMGNAAPEVQQHAQYVTKPALEGGVKHILEQLKLI